MLPASLLLLMLTPMQNKNLVLVWRRLIIFRAVYNQTLDRCVTEWGNYISGAVIVTTPFANGKTFFTCGGSHGLVNDVHKSYAVVYGTRIAPSGQEKQTKCGVFSYNVTITKPDKKNTQYMAMSIFENKSMSPVTCPVKNLESCVNVNDVILKGCQLFRCDQTRELVEIFKGCKMGNNCKKSGYTKKGSWLRWRKKCVCQENGKVKCQNK